jgi:hypothetical protein
MTPKAKLALVGLGSLAGLAALFAVAGTASASPATTQPSGGTPGPSNQWPSDGMPWNIYSATTLNRQRAYNAAVQAANMSAFDTDEIPLFGRPYLTEDGILGPNTCTELSYWQSWGGPNVPIACRVSDI